MKPASRLFALAVLLLLGLASPVAAATSAGSTALFGGYWQSFVAYWQDLFQKQNGVVMGILAVGALALFIITRGKWRNRKPLGIATA